MPSIVDTITSHQTKEIDTKHGKGTITTFFTKGGMELSTFKGAVASQANLLTNQPVEIEYDIRQNGEYTNYTLLSVKPADKGVTPISDAPGFIAPPNPQQAKDTAIAKAVALKAAVDSIGPLAANGVKTDDPGKITALAEFYYDWLTNP